MTGKHGVDLIVSPYDQTGTAPAADYWPSIADERRAIEAAHVASTEAARRG